MEERGEGERRSKKLGVGRHTTNARQTAQGRVGSRMQVVGKGASAQAVAGREGGGGGGCGAVGKWWKARQVLWVGGGGCGGMEGQEMPWQCPPVCLSSHAAQT